MMEDKTYESPQCLLLRVELHSCVLNASNESYTVDSYDLSWDDEEE